MTHFLHSHPFATFTAIILCLAAFLVIVAGCMSPEPPKQEDNFSAGSGIACLSGIDPHERAWNATPKIDDRKVVGAANLTACGNATNRASLPVRWEQSGDALNPSSSRPDRNVPGKCEGENPSAVIGASEAPCAVNLIEPEDLKDIEVTASVAVELGSMGFTVKAWHQAEVTVMQITDREGISFYMPKDATLKQCIDRYREKLNEFYSIEAEAKGGAI